MELFHNILFLVVCIGIFFRIFGFASENIKILGQLLLRWSLIVWLFVMVVNGINAVYF